MNPRSDGEAVACAHSLALGVRVFKSAESADEPRALRSAAFVRTCVLFLLLANGCAREDSDSAFPWFPFAVVLYAIALLYYLIFKSGLGTRIDACIAGIRLHIASGVPCPHLGYSCRTCADRTATITLLQQELDTLGASLAKVTSDNLSLVARCNADATHIGALEQEGEDLRNRIAVYEGDAKRAQDFENTLLQKEASLIDRERELDARECVRKDEEEARARATNDTERRRQAREEAMRKQARADDDEEQYFAQAHAIVEDVEQKYVLHDAAHTHHAVAALLYWGDRDRGCTHVVAHNHTVQSIKLRLQRTPVQLRESYEAMQRWKLFDAEMAAAEARAADAAREAQEADVRMHEERIAALRAQTAAAELAVAEADRDIFGGGDLGHDED